MPNSFLWACYGTVITVLSFALFMGLSGLDKLQYAYPYMAALLLSFALHLAVGWMANRLIALQQQSDPSIRQADAL